MPRPYDRTIYYYSLNSNIECQHILKTSHETVVSVVILTIRQYRTHACQEVA